MKTINESVAAVVAAHGWSRSNTAVAYHQHLLDLFSEAVSEADSPELAKIIKLIESGKWDRDPKHFYESMWDNPKHPLMLTHYTVSDFKKMDTFKVPGYSIGFALKDHDGSEEGGSGHKGRVEIVAVHNNSGISGVGPALVKAAIAEGGTVLDHFGGHLDKVYEPMGFEKYKEDPYNAAYDEGGKFKAKYGELPVIYRRLKKVEP